MKFSKITAISISMDSKPVYESFEKLKPTDMSFSLFLSLAVEEYVMNHKSITNAKYPRIMARIGIWNDCIGDLTTGDLIRINNRVAKLTNKLRKELNKRI